MHAVRHSRVGTSAMKRVTTLFFSLILLSFVSPVPFLSLLFAIEWVG